MKQRSLKYEQKFKKYLFSFDYDTFKEICLSLNTYKVHQE
jgi:hypothetical protein